MSAANFARSILPPETTATIFPVPAPPPIAAAIATDVLPRYFAALGPARPSPARPAPRVTVTLVRWPYT
jgi:hypothetical protein